MLSDVDEEVETIKKLGQWYLEDNATLRSVTIRANSESLKGVKKYWDSAVVRNILKNPIYVQNTPKVYEYFKNNKTTITNDISEFNGTKGLMLYGSVSLTKRHKLNAKLSDLYLSICNVNPIFSDVEWLKIQEKMLSRFSAPSRTGSGKVTFLGGLIKCKYCGATVGTSTSKIKSGVLRYFVCGTKKSKSASLCNLKHIRVEKIEEYVTKDIVKHFKDKNILKKLNNITENKPDIKNEKEKSNIENQIVVINDKINNLINAIADANNISLKYINQNIEKLDNEKITLEEKLKKLTMSAYKPNINVNKIKSIIDNIDTVFDTEDLEQKKIIAKTLIDKIILSNDEIHIIYKI